MKLKKIVSCVLLSTPFITVLIMLAFGLGFRGITVPLVMIGYTYLVSLCVLIGIDLISEE